MSWQWSARRVHSGYGPGTSASIQAEQTRREADQYAQQVVGKAKKNADAILGQARAPRGAETGRRSTSFTIFEGTSEIQRMIVGRAVTGLDVR